MTSHINDEKPASEVTIINQPAESNPITPKDKSVYMIAGSIVLGALLVSASIFFGLKYAVKQISSSGANVVAAGAQGVAPQAPGQPQAPSAPNGVKLKANTPFLGNANAKVTVVEYADYQCPFCEKFYTQIFPEIKSKYIDTGKIKFVYQDFAFLGADSNTLAEGSHCAADQGKFWQYHDYIFSHQGQENTGWATADKVKLLASAMGGLNAGQFNSCLDSGKYKQEVLDETAAGRGYGVSGTPTLFVNKSSVVGAQPVATFTGAIDAALK